MTSAVQVVALLEEYFNSGDVEEATSTLQVTLSQFVGFMLHQALFGRLHRVAWLRSLCLLHAVASPAQWLPLGGCRSWRSQTSIIIL